jgi:membrane-associated phospholipid phosphatase
MFPGWINPEINIVLFFQSLGSWLAIPMKFFTFLGSETFYLLIAPALYWCIDAAMGLRLGIYLSISAGVHSIIKILFHAPRPYWVDRDVTAFSSESSFGMPSGHSQNAVVVWGSLAASLKKKWATVGAVILIILIGLSRIYLGVHFPSDVLAGWMIGAILLWLLLRLEPRVVPWLRNQTWARQIVIVFLVSLAFIFIALLSLQALGDWKVPQEWIENAAASAPDAAPIDPLAITGIISNAAILFGLASGALWLWRRGGFNVHGTLLQLLLRYVIGLVGVILFWYGLDQVFPGNDDLLGYGLRYIRYALVGLWVSGAAPAVFIRLGLAKPKTP